MALSQYAFCNLGLSYIQLASIQSGALIQVTNGDKTITNINVPGLSTGFAANSSPVDLLRAASYAIQFHFPQSSSCSPTLNTVIGFSY